MEVQIQPNAPEPSRISEKKERAKKVKSDRFKWWQSLIILAATLVICITAGYYVSEKYLWNRNSDMLDKQLAYNKAQVDQKPNDSNLRVQLGYSYFLKGNTDNAIQQYLVAKNLDNKNTSAFLNLAIAYDKQGNNDNALLNSIQAVKLSPQDYEGYLMEGRSYRKLKMYKKATDALQQAIRFEPGNTDTLYEVGLVAEDQGYKTEAEKIFKETLSYDPTFKPAITELDRLTKK